MSIQFISPETVGTPKGHYSPGVVHNGVVYVAGQLPINKDGQVQLGTIEEQTALCMHNIEQILIAANSNLQHILKVNVFVTDIALWPRINAAYTNIMGNHKPARIVVPCNQLNYGCQIEIDCIAATL
ncbi:MAG: RidA family protein [Pyrinomonadaceae bacterium]|nr:RidA family protein [Sphingobacteriaceae bacterium]